MTDEPTLGSLPDQQYSAKEIERVAWAASKIVVAEPERDAGKVYCPCCRLREARWRRQFVDADRQKIHFFVYCTQCHKTGLYDLDLRERSRGCLPGLLALAVIIAACNV